MSEGWSIASEILLDALLQSHACDRILSLAVFLLYMMSQVHRKSKGSTMGHYPTGPTSCILDPTCHVRITSMWDGGPVCIFVFWVTVVLSCSTFFLWKQHCLKKHPVKPVVLQVGNLKGASHANQSSQSVPLQCNQRQYHNFCSQSCCGSILNPNTSYTWFEFSVPSSVKTKADSLCILLSWKWFSPPSVRLVHRIGFDFSWCWVCSDPKGEHSGVTKNEEIRLSLEGESEIQFTGYTRSYFGEFCYLLCCLVSLHWIALYIVILVDTYNNCEVGSIDNLCFFGNHFIFGTYELNGKVGLSFIPSPLSKFHMSPCMTWILHSSNW